MYFINYLRRGSDKSAVADSKAKEKIIRERLERIRTMREEFIQRRPEVYKDSPSTDQNQE